MNLEAVAQALPAFLEGLQVTAILLAASLALGLAGALPLAFARISRRPWLSTPVRLFTYVIRGTPMLVQLFLLYYGLAQFEAVRESAAWPWLSSAWFCAIAAFAINTCAYTTEILAGALETTPAGEIEAARALGMGPVLVVRRIVLPSALRRAIPAYSNEAILMLQGTSLASVVTLLDLTGAAREMNSVTYLPFEAFLTAAAFYLALTFVLVSLFHLAERRWLAHLAPRR